LVRKWQQTCTVIDAYGPTEATVIATACILDAEGSVNNIGLPLQGVTCYVLDEQLRQVPQGEKGELYIGGIQLTDGYLNKEELNRQRSS
jgi:non-ribosomal peptide synthetase component F